MKYYEPPRPKKSRRGLYTAAAFALIAAGAVIWYVTAGAKNRPETAPDFSVPQPSYYDENSTYTDSTPPETSSDVAGEAEDVPYESEETPESEPGTASEQTETKPQKKEPARLTRPLDGKVLKKYDDKTLQYSATYGDLRLHKGTDIAAEAGAEVITAGAGTVTGCEENALLGKTVTVDHGNGRVLRYCGLEKVAVAQGDSLIAGQTIGTVGSVPEECADVPHLHLEATLNGKPVSPDELF